MPRHHDLASPSVHASVARRRRARPATPRLAAAGAVVLLGVALAVLGPDGRKLLTTEAGSSVRAVTAGTPLGDGRAELGDRDGFLATGESISPFSEKPAITRLDPSLRAALHRAAEAAAADGVTLQVNSGWRSSRYQRDLLRRAVITYGSAEVARQWVKPPEESSHVTGEAIDIGPTDAAIWLSQHGGTYGLCQIYANERWHFERVAAPGGTCPALQSDATQPGLTP